MEDQVEILYWMPLLKSDIAADEAHKASCPFPEHRILRGLASCEDRDLQNEVVVQKGIDLMPFLERGYINYDHKGTPIGRPLTCALVEAEKHPVLVKSGCGVSGVALYAECELWPSAMEHRGADEAWATAQAANLTGRPFGYSIEGKAFQRDGDKITRSELRHLALTHQPVQQKSFALAELVKSMTLGAMAPTLLENLNGRITSILWGDSPCQKGCYDARGKFKKGREGALEHLTTCKGNTLEDSVSFLKSLIGSGIAR